MPHVAEPTVKGDEEPPFASGSHDDVHIGGSGEPLVCHRVRFMTETYSYALGPGSDVLVELYPQPGAGSSGSSSSWARWAA